jgi:hypothetical protein
VIHQRRPPQAADLHHELTALIGVGGSRPTVAVMTTPAMEQRIMELMPKDAKALLLLGRQLRHKVGHALDRIEGRKG